MIKFLIRTFIIVVAAVISYQYLIIYQTDDITEVDHYEQVGQGIGKTLKESIKQELKDTIQ